MCSGFDVKRLEPLGLYPFPDLPGDEFRAVVAADEFRRSSLGDQLFENANHFPCPHGVFHLQAKALACVFVKNHQPFQSSTSFGLVENKIVAPYMIPAVCSQPLGPLIAASKSPPLV